MESSWATADRQRNGKIKLIPCAPAPTPRVDKVVVQKDNEKEMVENDNKRFRTKIRIEVIVTKKKPFGPKEMANLLKAIYETDEDIVLKSVVNENLKIRNPDEIPNTSAAFNSFFHVEEFSRKIVKVLHLFMWMESNTRVFNIKIEEGLKKYCKLHNIYITEHYWESFRVYELGMITCKPPKVTNVGELEAKYQKMINKRYNKKMSQNEDDKSDDMSTKTEVTNNVVTEAPKIEIARRTMKSSIRDSQGRVMKESFINCLVFEIRCDKKDAAIIQSLLVNGDLDSRKYGKISMYDVTYNNKDLFRRILKEHVNFTRNMTTIAIHGLHENVMNTKISHKDYKEINDAVPEGYTLSEFFDIYGIYDEHNYQEVRQVEASIEQSIEDGKWHVITNNTDKLIVQKIIENFFESWMELESYKDHLGDNESYQRGLRYAYRAHKNDSELAHHEKKLIECTDKFDSGEESNASSLTSTSSKKRRKDMAFNRDQASQYENSWDANRLSWTLQSARGTNPVNQGGSVNSFTTTADDFNRFMKEQNEKLDSKLENDRVKQSKLNKELQEAIKNQSIQMVKLSENLDAKCDNIDMKLLNIEMKQDRFQKEIQEAMAYQVERAITQALSRQHSSFGTGMMHSPIQKNQDFSMEDSVDNQSTPLAAGPRTLFQQQAKNGEGNSNQTHDTDNLSMALDNSVNITMNDETLDDSRTIGDHRGNGDPQCG